MEMQKHIVEMMQRILFKIDLIVWKFVKVDIETIGIGWFKIDLIVWKLANMALETVEELSLK